MKLLGIAIQSKEVTSQVLESSERFLNTLLDNINNVLCLDDRYKDEKKIPNIDYYLVYNRIIVKGKKKIDKRIVRKISRQEIIEELDSNWMPGLEPNFILLPISKDYQFGIYIQGAIYYMPHYFYLPINNVN